MARFLCIWCALLVLGAAPPALAQSSGHSSAQVLMAEPQTPSGQFTTATEVRPILTATKSNWVALREFNGQDLLYVTQLWAWRCGLAQISVGVNGALPQVWPMPPCHIDTATPNAVQEGDGLPYVALPLGSVNTIEVQLIYDDLGRDTALFDRAGVLRP